MATLGEITYDAVADGAAVPDSGSGGEWDTVTGTIVGETDYAESSTRGAKITGQATCRKTVTTTNKWRTRWFHEQPVADPGANTSVAVARASTTVRAQVREQAGGTLILVNGASSTGSATGALVAGVRDRVEWWANGDTGQQGLELYRGANRHGTVPDDSVTGTYTNATVDNIGVGLFTLVSGFEVGQDSIKITDTPSTQIGGTATPASVAAPAIAAVATLLAPTIRLGAVVTPGVLAAVATMQPLVGQTGATVSPDVIAAVAALPAPAISAVQSRTATPAVIAAVADFFPAQLLTPQDATVTPGPIAAVAALIAPQRAGAPIGSVPAIDDLIFLWLGSRTTGATRADRERNYYAGLTGLPLATALSTLKRTYFGTQLGLSATQTAQRGLTALELAFWESVDPTNNTGSYQDRARRFYSS